MCLYASVLDAEHCADLVPVFFGIGRGTLCRFVFIYCVFLALDRMYIRFYSLRLNFQLGMWLRYGLLRRRCDTA